MAFELLPAFPIAITAIELLPTVLTAPTRRLSVSPIVFFGWWVGEGGLVIVFFLLVCAGSFGFSFFSAQGCAGAASWVVKRSGFSRMKMTTNAKPPLIMVVIKLCRRKVGGKVLRKRICRRHRDFLLRRRKKNGAFGWGLEDGLMEDFWAVAAAACLQYGSALYDWANWRGSLGGLLVSVVSGAGGGGSASQYGSDF